MNSTLLSSPDELIGAFQDALSGAAHVDVAVAWATRCDQVSSLCSYAKGRGKLRAIVGRDFAGTDPFAVERLLSASPGQIRWGCTPCLGIFHPKVFLFHHEDRITAIVGSANLTRQAFLCNVEVTMRLCGTADELSQLVLFFAAQWQLAEEINIESLETYKNHWRAQRECQLQAHKGLQPAGTGAAVAAATGPILSWTWDQYVDQLRRVDKLWQPFGHSIESYLDMLEEVPELARRPLSSLSKVQRLALLGIWGEEYPNAGWLGWMGAKGKARQALTEDDATSRQTQAAVTTALQMVPPGPTLPSLQVVGAAYQDLRKIKYVGPGIATRYLTLRRPDACVSVNGASQEGLSRILAVPVSRLCRWEGYEEGLKRLWEAPWMTAQRPTSCLEATFWDNRSALLDAFVYRPKSGEHPNVTWQ